MFEQRFFKITSEALRLRQWLKNLLIFVPAFAGHHLADWEKVLPLCLAFIAFCLASSVGYLINDLVDQESDRKHPEKSSRPIASGELSRRNACLIAVTLLLASGTPCVFLPVEFSITLGVYLILSISYSLFLKRLILLDLILLAAFYVIRVLSGGLAADILVSEWLLAASLFTFLSLGTLKRYSELKLISLDSYRAENSRRGYREGDLPFLATLGSTSGYLSVLVLALYISSEAFQGLYSNPRLLWLLCCLQFYWLARAWLIAERAELPEDLISFILRDLASLLILAAGIGILLLAT